MPLAMQSQRLQFIHLTARYLIGFASIFPFKAERFEGIDALDLVPFTTLAL